MAPRRRTRRQQMVGAARESPRLMPAACIPESPLEMAGFFTGSGSRWLEIDNEETVFMSHLLAAQIGGALMFVLGLTLHIAFAGFWGAAVTVIGVLLFMVATIMTGMRSGEP